MGRYPRYHPPTEREGTLVEITSRVMQGRALLRPSTKLNRRIIGVVGRVAAAVRGEDPPIPSNGIPYPSGAPRKIDDAQIEASVTRTLESTPRGATHWSTCTLAKAAGVSPMSVHRI